MKNPTKRMTNPSSIRKSGLKIPLEKMELCDWPVNHKVDHITVLCDMYYIRAHKLWWIIIRIVL